MKPEGSIGCRFELTAFWTNMESEGMLSAGTEGTWKDI